MSEFDARDYYFTGAGAGSAARLERFREKVLTLPGFAEVSCSTPGEEGTVRFACLVELPEKSLSEIEDLESWEAA